MNLPDIVAICASSPELDTSKPTGTPRKLMDVPTTNRLGRQARTSLREGLLKTYEWCVTET